MVAQYSVWGGYENTPHPSVAIKSWVAWFHDLDAWTEYWDVYHPETNGRFYFGDGKLEAGLLRRLLPQQSKPVVFVAWLNMASNEDARQQFISEVMKPEVSEAIVEIDGLIARLFERHFGDARLQQTKLDYLQATFMFATNTLPPADERFARIDNDDPRKSTSGRHTLEGDLMWFAWAYVIECAQVIFGEGQGSERRKLQLAAIAMGCPVNFAWRGHRRTRIAYRPDQPTADLLMERANIWANSYDLARREVYALYCIREWGIED